MIRMIAALLVAGFVTVPYPGEREYGAQAKLTIARARAIAVRAYPGKIIEEELEKEPGGSGLRYSFIIQHGPARHEVGVDARTGKVLKNVAD
jgi:uncharacterized membrane protein YkoI